MNVPSTTNGKTMREWITTVISRKCRDGVSLAEVDKEHGMDAARFGIDIPTIHKEYNQ